MSMADPAHRNDPYNVQYYVITASERARLKEALSPLSAFELEAHFKKTLNAIFMAQPYTMNIKDGLQFCIFKHALIAMRNTAAAPESQARCAKYKDILLERQARYEGIYARLIAPLTPLDIKEPRSGSATLKYDLHILNKTASAIAHLESGLAASAKPEELQYLEARLKESRTDAAKALGYSQPQPKERGLLQIMKPW